MTVRPRRRMLMTGVSAGVVIAVAAVAAGAFFEVRPPDAYGLCMACHGRDLINGVSNAVWDTRLTVAPSAAVFPLLTTVGVLIGALVAAVFAGEFRFRLPRKPFKNFTHGILVMNLALLAAGCSARLLLRTSAGDWLGAIGFGAMVIGVVLGTHRLRRRALR